MGCDIVHSMERERIAREIFAATLGAANPAEATGKHAGRLRALFQEERYGRLFVIGFGKAAVPMARALEEPLGDLITGGIVITRYGHTSGHPGKVRVIEAGHPVPDDNGVRGTGGILDLVANVDERTLVVVLVSGGGSALFVSPCAGISLGAKQETTELLLRAGAEIDELNRVRKHLSNVKGGRLAQILHPATVVSLILSDVIGDRLDVIASGPTSPDPTTYGDALATLDKYGLKGQIPQPVVQLLERGKRGLLPETPKEGNPVFRKVENQIIGSNRLALNAAQSAAQALGFRAQILSEEISGEAREAGIRLAREALAARLQKGAQTVCLIAGGETTVTVTGTGKGGRNMELALAFAMEIQGIYGITLLSAGTDGTDGPTDAAGAVVDGKTAARARMQGLVPEEYLRNNDSYGFFRETGNLLITGPTGTNVMDIQIVVIA